MTIHLISLLSHLFSPFFSDLVFIHIQAIYECFALTVITVKFYVSFIENVPMLLIVIIYLLQDLWY